MAIKRNYIVDQLAKERDETPIVGPEFDCGLGKHIYKETLKEEQASVVKTQDKDSLNSP